MLEYLDSLSWGGFVGVTMLSVLAIYIPVMLYIEHLDTKYRCNRSK